VRWGPTQILLPDFALRITKPTPSLEYCEEDAEKLSQALNRMEVGLPQPWWSITQTCGRKSI
jgi:hypothetical protein